MVPCMYKYILHLFCPSLTAAWALQRSLHFSSLVLFTIRPKLLWSRTIIFLDYLNVKKKHCRGISQELYRMFFMFTWSKSAARNFLPNFACSSTPIEEFQCPAYFWNIWIKFEGIKRHKPTRRQIFHLHHLKEYA